MKANWHSESRPELVLMDGRLREALFLNSLLIVKARTKITFNNYSTCPHYDVVEEIINLIEAYDRQVLFVVTTNVAIDKIKALFEKFNYIIDTPYHG